MRIESTAIALRRREPWEAIDLGFAMLREWWRPVYAAWAVTFVPVAGMVIYALRDEPALAALLLWWLKPVFDRIVLHVLSRAVFGDEVPVKRLPADWREYPEPRPRRRPAVGTHRPRAIVRSARVAAGARERWRGPQAARRAAEKGALSRRLADGHVRDLRVDSDPGAAASRLRAGDAGESKLRVDASSACSDPARAPRTGESKSPSPTPWR